MLSHGASFFRVRERPGQSDAGAQNNLGFMYSNGRGVEGNHSEVVAWYRKAAEQGDAEAQFCLGCAYEFGEGVDQSDDEAFKWYQMAAEKGHAKAMKHAEDVLDQSDDDDNEDENEKQAEKKRSLSPMLDKD